MSEKSEIYLNEQIEQDEQIEIRLEIMAFAEELELRMREYDSTKGENWRTMSFDKLIEQYERAFYKSMNAFNIPEVYTFYDLLDELINTSLCAMFAWAQLCIIVNGLEEFNNMEDGLDETE